MRVRKLKWLTDLGDVVDENEGGSLPEEGSSQEEQGISAGVAEEVNGSDSGLSPPSGCNPVEWIALRWEVVLKHRNLFCLWSGDCVDYAALERWQGFSCTQCEKWEKGKGKGKKGDKE